MVGGTVVEVASHPERLDVLFVNVADKPYSKVETCGVFVERNQVSERIRVGDSLWWHCGLCNCYWTPKENLAEYAGRVSEMCDGVDRDIPIAKKSYSGVTNPWHKKPEKVEAE
jgi:hypothetical protein